MTTEQKILNALTEHSELTKSELKDICKASEREIAIAVFELVDKKLIKRIKQGVYALDNANYTAPKQTSLFGE